MQCEFYQKMIKQMEELKTIGSGGGWRTPINQTSFNKSSKRKRNPLVHLNQQLICCTQRQAKNKKMGKQMSYTVHCPRMPAIRATWQEWGQSCEISSHDKGILWRHPKQRIVIPSKSVCSRCVFGFGHPTQQEWQRADISDLDDVHRNIRQALTKCQTLSKCAKCFTHKSSLILTDALQEGSITILLPYITEGVGIWTQAFERRPWGAVPSVLFPRCTALRSWALEAQLSQHFQLCSSLHSEWRGWQGALVHF